MPGLPSWSDLDTLCSVLGNNEDSEEHAASVFRFKGLGPSLMLSTPLLPLKILHDDTIWKTTNGTVPNMKI